jgi:hypothetical protein
MDLVTHSSVEIDAAAVDVWPFILEPNDWKQGLKPVWVSGEANAVGEIREAKAEHEGVAVVLRCETVALEPYTRKVIKISIGSPLDPAWAAWILQEAGGTTTVSYDVYSQVPVPDDQAEAYMRDNRDRFDAELLALKELVESRS